MQALPRKSIKNHQYNFADILGDINYIGDEKLPTFQSRALAKDKMSKFITDDKNKGAVSASSDSQPSLKPAGTFSMKNL